MSVPLNASQHEQSSTIVKEEIPVQDKSLKIEPTKELDKDSMILFNNVLIKVPLKDEKKDVLEQLVPTDLYRVKSEQTDSCTDLEPNKVVCDHFNNTVEENKYCEIGQEMAISKKEPKLEIENNYDMQSKIFSIHLKKESDLESHLCDSNNYWLSTKDGSTSKCEDKGNSACAEMITKTTLKSLGRVSTESQSEYCKPALPEVSSEPGQNLSFCKEENSAELDILNTLTFSAEITNEFNGQYESLKDIISKVEIKDEKVELLIDLVPTDMSLKLEKKYLCFEEQPNQISSYTLQELISVPENTSFKIEKHDLEYENSDGHCKRELNMKMQAFECDVSRQSSSGGRSIENEDSENRKEIYMKRNKNKSNMLQRCTDEMTFQTDTYKVTEKEVNENTICKIISEVVEGVTFTFDVCNKSFSHTSHLVSHKRSHTKEKPFACDVCNKRFSQTSHLVTHKRTHTKEKPFACDVCNKRFSDGSSLVRHKRTHTKERPFSCDVCNKRFSQNVTLVIHKRTHKKRPFNCKVCNKRFSNTSNLISHKRTHTKERHFNCDVCNKRFSRMGNLVTHKRTHTKEKPFTCDVCNKRFSRMGNLVTHKRTHTKEKPFTCDVCNKSFSHTSHLVTHKRTHTKEKPFTCDVCNKSFSQTSHLVTHKRTHTNEKPFACDVCSKRFSLMGGLVRHKRTHTKERPFTCDVCNKRFSDRSTLARHERTHTKEKPLTCDLCNKSYSSKRFLKKHLGIHFTY